MMVAEPETSSFSIRQPTTIKTKGGICIMLYFFGTSLLFINSHLSAHHDNVQDRISDYKRICRGLDFPKILPIKSHRYTSDITSMFDYVFWFGDLNFRISQPRDAVLEQVSTNGQPRFSQAILKHDQLLSLITEGSAFKGFSEAPIHFPPTYKYDPGTGNWDSSDKQRTPAYTDRILYRCKTSRTVKSLAYDSLTYVKTSDHKPVWGLFTVTIRPGSEANVSYSLFSIPLSAGLFQRDIYLAALERRATALEIKKRKTMPSKSKSLVCSIQ
ncbi:unnamed protein product [Darwinula stevensoni]|uniref:Inositol polyphosphate-related phosphatase domain-containing protein n=1 Tax=Darwinula stevensoni TaxID=69355 RepID=A0A7R8XCX0_9CRUS|nr:unnamed protein product [Darwinula stevensoni]CAG0888022.1 unnamed protein product [Darwinula stevensoni]